MNYPNLINGLEGLVARFREGGLELLPRLAGSLAILGVGFIVASLLRFLIRRLIRGLDRFVPSQKLQTSLRHLGMQRPAAEVISGIFYWIVILFFLTAATETLGLPVVTTWLSGVALYLPRILSAVVVCFAGLLGGILLRDLIVSATVAAGMAYGRTLGRLAQGAVILVAVVVAVDLIGINIGFVTTVTITLLGVVLLGGALAFGLGARMVVGNILASHYLQKSYAVGQRVKIGEWEGEIVQITPVAVLLQTAEGRALVPAKLFGESVSVLLAEEG